MGIFGLGRVTVKAGGGLKLGFYFQYAGAQHNSNGNRRDASVTISRHFSRLVKRPHIYSLVFVVCKSTNFGGHLTTNMERQMAIRFYEPDLTSNPDSPFVRDGDNKLIRRSYWLDMDDRTLVMVMTKGIGANLTNDEKRAHLTDIKRQHLIDQICVQEILPPQK
jgi:hypothetical protein